MSVNRYCSTPFASSYDYTRRVDDFNPLCAVSSPRHTTWAQHCCCLCTDVFVLFHWLSFFVGCVRAEPMKRYEGCRKSTCFDNSPRYVKFNQKLAPLLEVNALDTMIPII